MNLLIIFLRKFARLSSLFNVFEVLEILVLKYGYFIIMYQLIIFFLNFSNLQAFQEFLTCHAERFEKLENNNEFLHQIE